MQCKSTYFMTLLQAHASKKSIPGYIPHVLSHILLKELRDSPGRQASFVFLLQALFMHNIQTPIFSQSLQCFIERIVPFCRADLLSKKFLTVQ